MSKYIDKHREAQDRLHHAMQNIRSIAYAMSRLGISVADELNDIAYEISLSITEHDAALSNRVSNDLCTAQEGVGSTLGALLEAALKSKKKDSR